MSNEGMVSIALAGDVFIGEKLPRPGSRERNPPAPCSSAWREPT